MLAQPPQGGCASSLLDHGSNGFCGSPSSQKYFKRAESVYSFPHSMPRVQRQWFEHFEYFGPRLGPGISPDASGSLRYCWARGQREIWSTLSRKKYLFIQVRSPSHSYPFFGPLIHAYLFISVSTNSIVFLSFPTRSSDLISVSQSLPNHACFESG